MIKKAINNPERIVDEVIEGLVFASHGRLTKVPGVRAIMRTSIEDGKVALLIGGGSGHEPIYTTYVGPGFADAAACGNIFAAPSPQIIFEATKAIQRGKGVLYVYGNYEGDVMNFDVAVEMAADEGIEVGTVRTMDDASLPKGEDRWRRLRSGPQPRRGRARHEACSGEYPHPQRRIAAGISSGNRTADIQLGRGRTRNRNGRSRRTRRRPEENDARRSARRCDDGTARRRLSPKTRRSHRAPRQRPRRDDDDGAPDRQPKSEAAPRTAWRRRP